MNSQTINYARKKKKELCLIKQMERECKVLIENLLRVKQSKTKKMKRKKNKKPKQLKQVVEL